MVGHTGNIEAVAKALEALDGCVERVVEAIEKANGNLLIIADHGNCEHNNFSESIFNFILFKSYRNVLYSFIIISKCNEISF